MKARVLVTSILTFLAFVARGVFSYVTKALAIQDDLLDGSIRKNNWVYPIFIISWFSFADIMPVVGQVVSVQIIIDNYNKQKNVMSLVKSKTASSRSTKLINESSTNSMTPAYIVKKAANEATPEADDTERGTCLNIDSHDDESEESFVFHDNRIVSIYSLPQGDSFM